MSQVLANLRLVFSAETDGAVAGIDRTAHRINLVEKTAIAATIGITALGGAITALGKAGADFAGDFIGTAIQWDTRMMELQNNTGSTNEVLKEMDATIQSIGSKSNTKFEELTEGLEKIRDHGYSAASSQVILDSAMKAASTTGSDTAMVAQLLANTMHQYGLEAEDASKVTDVLMLSAQRTNATFEQFASNANIVLALGANLQVPYWEVAAALAALEKNGFAAAEAQTQVKNMLTHIIKPAVQAKDELKAVSKASGVDLVGAFSAAGLAELGLTGVMERMREAYMKLGFSQAGATEQTMKFLNAQRGGIGAAVLTGKAWADYKNILADYGQIIEGKVSPSEIAYQNALKNTGYQLGILGNNWTLFTKELGAALAPTIKIIVGFIQGVVGFFRSLSPEMKEFIAQLIILTSVAALVIGPLLMMVAMLPLIAAGFSLLTSPLFFLVGGITALITVISLLFVIWLTNWNGMRDAITSIVNNYIMPAVNLVGNWFGAVWPNIVNIFASIVNGFLIPAFSAVVYVITTYVIPALLSFGNFAIAVINAVLPTLLSLGQIALWVFVTVLGGALQIAAGLFNLVAGYITRNIETLKVAFFAFSVVLIINALPAIIAFGVGAISTGLAVMASWAPMIALFMLIGGAVALLRTGWENDWLGMRTQLTNFWNQIKPILEAIWGAIVWLWDRLVEFWNWLTGTSAQVGQQTGNNLMNGLDTGITGGMGDLNTNILGIGANLGSLQQPAGIMGFNTGNNWISNMNNAIAQGMGVMATNINRIAGMLATLKAGKELEGVGFGEGYNQEGHYISPEEARQNYIKKLQEEMDKYYRGIYYYSQRGAEIPSSAFTPTLFTGETGENIPFPEVTKDTYPGFTGENGPAPDEEKAAKAKKAKSAIQEATDQVKNIAAAIRDGIKAMMELSTLHVPDNLAPKIEEFAQATNMIMMRLQKVALGFSDEILDKLNLFSDAAKSAFSMLSEAFKFFEMMYQSASRVLDPANQLAAYTQILMLKTVIIMNNLAAMTKNWDFLVMEVVKTFAESAKAVFEMLSVAFEFFIKIYESGARVLAPANQLAALTVTLSEKVVIVMNILGSLIPMWDEFSSTKVKIFGEATAVVFGAFVVAYGFFEKLAETGRATLSTTNQLASLAVSLGEKITIVMNEFGKGIAAWTDPGWTDQVKRFAEASETLFKMLNTVTEFFTSILTDIENLDASIEPIKNLLLQMAPKIIEIAEFFLDHTTRWTDPAMAARVEAFGKAAEAVIKGLNATFQLFLDITQANTMLASLDDLTLLAMNLGSATVSISDSLEITTTRWTTEISKRVEDFSKSAQESMKGLGETLSLMTAIMANADVFDGMDKLVLLGMDLVSATVSIMDSLEIVTPRWTIEISDRVAALGKAIKDSMEGLQAALEFMKAVSEGVTVPDSSSVEAVIDGALAIVKVFHDKLANIGVTVEKDAVEQQAMLAEIAKSFGDIFSSLGNVLELFIKLSESGSIFGGEKDPMQFVDSLLNDMNLVIKAFQEKLPIISEGTATVAKLIGEVASGLNNMVTLLNNLGEGTLPSDSKIASFIAKAASVIRQLPVLIGALAEELRDDAKELGEKLGPAIQLLIDTVNLFKAITGERDEKGVITGQMLDPDPAAIGALTGKLWLTITLLKRDLIDKIGPELWSLAKEFGEKFGPAITLLKDTLDLFKGMMPDKKGEGGFQAPDPANIEGLVGSVYTLLIHWKNLVHAGAFQDADFAGRSQAFVDMISAIVGAVQQTIDLVNSLTDIGGVDVLIETFNKLREAMGAAAGILFPNLVLANSNMFTDINKEMERQGAGSDTDTMSSHWAGDILGGMSSAFSGRGGLRWEMPLAFQDMFTDISTKLTEWGPTITGAWKKDILDIMVEDTRAAMAEIRGLMTQPLEGTQTPAGQSSGGNTGGSTVQSTDVMGERSITPIPVILAPKFNEPKTSTSNTTAPKPLPPVIVPAPKTLINAISSSPKTFITNIAAQTPINKISLPSQSTTNVQNTNTSIVTAPRPTPILVTVQPKIVIPAAPVITPTTKSISVASGGSSRQTSPGVTNNYYFEKNQFTMPADAHEALLEQARINNTRNRGHRR